MILSANVWFEEVNTGLVEEIKSTVKVKDAHGVLTALGDDNIVIRKPEEDFKIEVFPSVSIYNVTYKHDPLRYNPNPVVVSTDKEKKTMTLEDPAVAFNLTYQLDFWAKYQTDMDSMTRTWLLKHFRQFNLKVIDDGGVERSSNVLLNESMKSSDLIKNQKRLFHSVISYVIWVELDDEVGYNVHMVADRVLKADSSESSE